MTGFERSHKRSRRSIAVLFGLRWSQLRRGLQPHPFSSFDGGKGLY
jgi:hypothetical protein